MKFQPSEQGIFSPPLRLRVSSAWSQKSSLMLSIRNLRPRRWVSGRSIQERSGAIRRRPSLRSSRRTSRSRTPPKDRKTCVSVDASMPIVRSTTYFVPLSA